MFGGSQLIEVVDLLVLAGQRESFDERFKKTAATRTDQL